MNKFYDDDYEFAPFLTKHEEKCKILVVNEDTLGAAEKFSNPCCLNFASHKRPGGGYESVIDVPMPIKTQEEDLFRRSNLPELMDIQEVRKHYPLKGLQAFYTNEVVVNKNKYLGGIDPFEISIITMPAVINPQTKDHNLIRNKIERILLMAIENGHDNLILGAWGCGIFNNDPLLIATLFGDFLNYVFHDMFKHAIFAIPNKESENYKIFEKTLVYNESYK
jgi:uncharacterized protein (TIGR02452 family)